MDLFKQNVAVFLGTNKRFSGVNLEVTGSVLSVKNRMDGTKIMEFNVVEPVAVSGDRVFAWDISDPQQGPPARERLTAVIGCGCGGLPPVTPDPGYVGV